MSMKSSMEWDIRQKDRDSIIIFNMYCWIAGGSVNWLYDWEVMCFYHFIHYSSSFGNYYMLG
jgi:hypothetical protein